MMKESYRPPQFLTIGLGIGLFVLVLLVLCSLSQGVKWAGSVLSFLPERLGLLRTVRPAEVFRIDMSHTLIQVQVAKAGPYLVYTSDYDLLVISEQLAQSDAPPWITITSASSSATTAMHYITRGLLPYDTPHARGRPVMRIEFSEPGEYLLDYPTRPAEMALVPDYVTGHEALILTAYAVQILIVALPFALLLYRREHRLWQQLREKRERTTEQFEKMRRLTRSQSPSGDDPEGTAPRS